MSNNHQIEAHIYFGKILRGWDAYEGYKYFHPDTKLTEEEYYSFVENLRYKPGRIVPATGGAQIAEVFNAAKENDDGELPGEHSHAEGIDTFARGRGSHAEGVRTKTTAMGAHAEGEGSMASGNDAHAEGRGTKASGETSHAEGLDNEASGYSAHAEGKNTRASYDCDHAEGYGTRASGGYTHAEGKNTQAAGTCSHSEGNGTVASGANSHAEGTDSQARALNSHAEGEGSIVESSAKSGHAGGKSSIVESEAGFAHGVNAVSKNRGEAVFGKNNDPDTTGKSMFQVGIGSNKNNPKTGFQIDSDGTIWVINTNTGSRISLQSWLNDIQLKKIVVDQLPEAGAPSTVYLLRVTAPDESRHNFFEEYIYIDGAWEMLGTSDSDESIIERILSNPAFKVESQQIADNAIQARHLSGGCVTSDSIQDGAIHNEKIAPKTITHDKIADGAITRDLLAPEVEKELDDLHSDVSASKEQAAQAERTAMDAMVFGSNTAKDVAQLQTALDNEVQTRTTEATAMRADYAIRVMDLDKKTAANHEATVHITQQDLTETQQERAFENLGIKTVFVDSATEIGVALSEERANEIGSALRVVLDYPGVGRLVFSIGLPSAEDYEFYTCASPGYLYNARLNKKSRILRILTLSYLDSTAVKFHSQKLTEGQQEQAFENLGIKTVFVDYETEIGVVLSEERIAEIISATQIVIETPEMGKLVLPRTNLDSTYCYFQLLYAADRVYRITVTRAQRTLSTHTHQLSDAYSVKFAWAQNLSDNNKKIARANIGAQEELSVESKPNGNISILGLGDAPVDLVPADRLAPYVLKLIASADAPGGYTLEGTTEKLEATARSIASNPHARVYLDCSIVTGIPTPIPMSIIMSDAEGGVVYLEADPYVYDGMIQYAGTSELDISVIVSIGPELLQVIIRKSVSEEIKKRLFIDMWNDACEDDGTYNSDTGYFELNGIIDIPYDEAIRIYNAWSWGYSGKSFINVSSDDIHTRTLIPIRARKGSDSVDLKGICSNNISIECINIQMPNVCEISSIYFSFFNCIKLRAIKGLLTLSANVSLTGAFMQCYELETVYINRLRGDINLIDSSKISLESLSYMVNNASNTSAITITVHANVYAKLAGDTTNDAAAALTEEELAQWMALVETATEKNITFATA